VAVSGWHQAGDEKELGQAWQAAMILGIFSRFVKV